MLQWMGGSRRKVATSRKSTQKRQKQYFEQRKRQHQQYEAAFVEHNVDASATCDHHRGGRSLDILSLLNVSNVTETRRALCDNGNISTLTNKAISVRSPEVVDSTIHQPSISKNTPASLNHEASTTGHGEPISARTPSSQHLRTMSSEGTWRNASNVRKTESECLKNASSNQLSILDLIGDDGATTASEGNPAHEAHVAFSIEGLGDIGTKTPMQSPRRPGRRLSGDQSSFTKAFKKPHPFKNFNTMLDDLGMEEKRLVEETEKPSKDDHLDSFSISEDVLYPFSSADHEPLILKNDMQLDKGFWMNSFHKQDRHHNLWNADSSFLDNGGNYDKRLLNWKNGIGNDNPYSWRKDSPDLKFEGCNSLLRYQKEVTDTFNVLGEGDSLLRSVDDPKCSSFMCNCPQAGYSPAQKPCEDPRDTLTSFSEESCSSSAVRDQRIADVPSRRCRRRFVEDLQRPLESNATENYDERVHNRVARSMRQGEDCDGFRRSNLSHVERAYFSPVTFNEKLVDEDPWLPDKGFPYSNNNSHWGSFYPLSEKNRFWEAGLSGHHEESDLLCSTKCSYGRYEKDTRDEFSSENRAFFQPFCSRKQSFDISCFPKASSGESWLGVHHDFEPHIHSSNSFEVADFFGETESAASIQDFSAQGSVTEEGAEKPKTQPTAPEKIIQVPTDSNNINPESRTAGDASSKDSGGLFGTAKNPIPHDAMAYSSDEDVTETSIAMKIHDESDKEVIAEELQESVPATHQEIPKASMGDAVCFRARCLDGECPEGPKPKAVPFERSCQVMMVERYVLQLLCLAKGKAVLQGATKKLL